MPDGRPADLVIIGAGGHGREVLDIVTAVNAVRRTWNFLGFLDDGPVDLGRLDRLGVELLGATDLLPALGAHHVIGIGDGAIRRRVDAVATAAASPAARLVHPLASVGADVELGPGCVLFPGARVTTNVRVGRHTHLNANSVLSHDCSVGDYVTLSPLTAVNGSVTLGDEVYLGTGSSVLPGLSIGAGAMVGAGAVVIGDLPAGCTAVGVPARPRP